MSRLENVKIGLIGAGNMGRAIISGLVSKNIVDRIYLFDISTEKAREIGEKFKVTVSESIGAVVSKSDILIIAVKPGDVAGVLHSIEKLDKDKIVLSVAAGITLESMEKLLGADKKIIRAMPNTPALIGEGMTVLSPNSSLDNESLEAVKEIFQLTGTVLVLPEKHMDAVTGLSGSGPAYVFTFIQALADGGVKMGLPRKEAEILSAQTVLGAAKMVLESGKGPVELRNSVTSPGGTTIEGLHSLEKGGFSGLIMDAVEAATKRSRSLG
jgi:pyrroline-5-carboxylate reductase